MISARILKYWPLLALIFIAALSAGALTHGLQKGVHEWMHFFMGCFLCQFAMLKLFHPSNFAEGFVKYDVLAKYIPGYAYLYPLIELGLGLAYLSFAAPAVTYSLTLFFMGIGAIGVVVALSRGLNIKCACMGTVLDVPLSTVTLSEDITMALMAVWMLLNS